MDRVQLGGNENEKGISKDTWVYIIKRLSRENRLQGKLRRRGWGLWNEGNISEQLIQV